MHVKLDCIKCSRKHEIYMVFVMNKVFKQEKQKKLVTAVRLTR